MVANAQRPLRVAVQMDALETIQKTERPKAFFTQPRLQSTTGSRASRAQLHQLLHQAQGVPQGFALQA